MVSEKALIFQLYLFRSSETDNYPLPAMVMILKKIMIPGVRLIVEEIATNFIEPGYQRYF